ncbi:NAD-dependent succinate-semialdehyde dehydrogenase [bacterium]|nr:NAD-dependent succinate-semialdehyde dehydrogenase [bacterium]
MTIKTINPATGKVLADYALDGDATILSKIEKAYGAFRVWRNYSFEERSKILKKAAELFLLHKQEHALLMTREMGKPITQAVAEVEKSALGLNYYADHAASLLAPQKIETDGKPNHISFEPLGLVLGIMPWNFPFWQVMRFAAPTLMAGNGILLKHAPNVWGCAAAIEDVFKKAGVPDGLLTNLWMDVPKVESVLSHPYVQGVSLTGSQRAGKQVAALAGKYLKKSVLELGGSDPYIVCDDADFNLALNTCMESRFNNAGQVCIAAKKFIVHESLYKKFKEGLVESMQKLVVGNPENPDTKMGPMARDDLRDMLKKQVGRSVERGAFIVCQNLNVPKQGFYYPPTLLTEVKPGMPAFDEEVFGPVAVMIPFKTDDEAIQLANHPSFGLGAAVFTRDEKRASQFVKKIEAGVVAVNSQVRSDPRLPFGGIKESGYGRELGSFGIMEFANIKTVLNLY